MYKIIPPFLFLAFLSLTTNGLSFSTNRRSFLNQGLKSAFVAAAAPQIANAADAKPQILTTDNGVKYAITKAASGAKRPAPGDIVAIEYTG